VKRRSVCCNRDIAKTRTEVRVDWGSEFERTAPRVTVRELNYRVTAVHLNWLVQLNGELAGAVTANDGPQQSAPSWHTAFCMVSLYYCSAIITKHN
jgi:hypothetical protein